MVAQAYTRPLPPLTCYFVAVLCVVRSLQQRAEVVTSRSDCLERAGIAERVPHHARPRRFRSSDEMYDEFAMGECCRCGGDGDVGSVLDFSSSSQTFWLIAHSRR